VNLRSDLITFRFWLYITFYTWKCNLWHSCSEWSFFWFVQISGKAVSDFISY